MLISGIDRYSRLRAFSFDHFKIYLDPPDRPERTQFYSSDRGRLRRLGRL